MPVVYHGTQRNFAEAMVGPFGGNGTIDVTRGSGEFGRGFYTQDSKSFALTRGQNRPGQSCLLELDIGDRVYTALKRRKLDAKKAERLTRRIREKKTVATHVVGVDVVVGPLNGSNWIEQHKFEIIERKDSPQRP